MKRNYNVSSILRSLPRILLAALLVLAQVEGMGQVWTSRTSAADNSWNEIVYSAERNLFVAVATSGTNQVMTSTDGITWALRTTPSGSWSAVTYGHWTASVTNKALTSNVATLTTSTAHNYSVGMDVTVTGVDATFNGTYTITAVTSTTFSYAKTAANVASTAVSPVGAASAGLFVAVSASANSASTVMTSPNGFTWTLRTGANGNAYNSITYGKGLFVATATSNGSPASNNRVMTSPDGINWTERTTPNANSYRGVTFGNNMFVAVATSGTGNRVMTSADGITWTSRTSAADNQWFSVVWGNGLFVAVSVSGNGNQVMTSPDGTTWTPRTTLAAIDVTNKSLTSNVATLTTATSHGYKIGQRIVVSDVDATFDGEYQITAVTSNTISYSKTATNVSSTAVSPAGKVPIHRWYDVTFADGRFIAVSEIGTGNRVMTSTDGINWSTETSATDNNWRGVAHAMIAGESRFVAVANSGTGNRVMTRSAAATLTTSGTLSAFTTCAGTASTAQSFNVSGSSLTANVVVTPPTGYEVSTTQNGTYSSSLPLTPTSGTLASTAVWVRLSSSATNGATGNVTVASTGATTQNVATGTGTVNATNTAGAASSTPTLCVNTALTNITHTTTGATGISNAGVSGANGLPGGVSASWANNTITISGTPIASGTFSYSILLTGGCGTVNATGTITVNRNTVGAASSTPTLCINSALTNITHTTTGATGIGTATGLPAGVTAAWSGNTITISGTPTASGTFNYSIPLTGACPAPNPPVITGGTITEHTQNGITYRVHTFTSNGTLTVSTGGTVEYLVLAGGGGGGSRIGGGGGAGGLLTGSTTVTATSYSIVVGAGGTGNKVGTSEGNGNPGNNSSFNSLTAVGGGYGGTTNSGSNGNAGSGGSGGGGGFLNVTENVGGSGTSGQGYAGGTGMGSTYGGGGGGGAGGAGSNYVENGDSDKGGAGGAGASSSITGTATWYAGGGGGGSWENTGGVGGSGIGGNGATNASGTQANGGNGATNTGSGGGGGYQGGDGGSGIVIIRYALTNTNNATGTITVTEANTAGAASSTPTLCINTALTNITHTTTGATGIGTATGLPAGVTAAWATNTITISGTPTASGTFNYSIPLTGGCGSVNATGTITVTAVINGNTSGTATTICALTTTTLTGGTVTGGSGTYTYQWQSSSDNTNWSTAPGTSTSANYTTTSLLAASTYFRRIVTSGGCSNTAASVLVTVTPLNTVGAASSTPTLCINAPLTNITHTTTGATGIGTATGLPAGVTASWATSTITISGTPTASGTFNYSIPLTGGCTSSNNAPVATGGTVVDYTQNGVNYRAHIFTSNGTLNVTTGGNMDVLIVAGGGGGGSYGGGGGAGGVIMQSTTVTTGSKTVTVGNGGIGVLNSAGTDGGESSFNGLAAGGGGGGAYSDLKGRIGVNATTVGGSAGGSGRGTAQTAASAGTPAGNNSTTFSNASGANPSSGWMSGSGGGGAGAVGYDGAADLLEHTGTAAEGGIGITSNITGSSQYYGGGGGGTWQTGFDRPDGGLGGGGSGATNSLNSSVSGSANTGGGGGGGWASGGGNGGSGIVIVRYALVNNFSATGTITVNQNTAALPSSMPTVCVNTALTSITQTTTGATGISNAGVSGANGLPAGVSAAWATNTITISGTPTASGTFDYSIPLTGGCSGSSATGRVMVIPTPTITSGAVSTIGTNAGSFNIPYTATTGSPDQYSISAGSPALTSFNSVNNATLGANAIMVTIPAPSVAGTYNFTLTVSNSIAGCTSASTTVPLTIAALFDSPFLGGSGGDGGMSLYYFQFALPLSLLDFTGEAVNSNVRLRWKTAWEQGTSHFEVERSMDASRFTRIGTVKAAGNSDKLRSYEFMDEAPPQGIVYYRLRMVDADGKFSYSSIVRVRIDGRSSVTIGPNPTGGLATMVLPASWTGRYECRILSASGAVVYRQTGLRAGRHILDLSRLSNGLYRVTLWENGESVDQQWILRR